MRGGVDTAMAGVLRLCFRLAWIVVGLLCLTPVIAADWDLESDTWVAADALGRVLPGAVEAGHPKTNRTVCIFYFLWLDRYAGGGPYDITKLLAANPTNPNWGPRWSFHHWGEPELGYYASDDAYVIRRHCQMLVDAGVDVICFDVTNALTYTPEYMKLCGIYQQIRREGAKTPQICFMANSSSAQTVQTLYDEFYSRGLHQDLWFHWMGKPLMLAPSDGLSPTLLDFFTLRRTWAWNAGQDNWTFIDHYPQTAGWHTPGVPEQISVTVAQHPISNIGRSFHGGGQPAIDQHGLCPTTGQGLCFAEQWNRALQVAPPFLFITGWNEWIAQRFIEGLDHDGIALCGRPLNDGESFFVDAYNQEFSRDIEPMKDGHTDNYYYQMIAGIRKYKGSRPAMGAGTPRTITIDGDFSDWADVEPDYRDTVGDTEHRYSVGYAGANTYTNTTGRNDFIRMKVARDTQYVYFCAETVDDISPSTDPNWMLLFIDSDRNPSTGWYGYDYIVNYPVLSSTSTTVAANSGGWNWTQVGAVPYRVTGNKLELRIPKSFIGLGSGSSVALDFHWADNIQRTDDIAQFFINGDSAPNRRFNYRYDTAASGPPWEFDTAGNREGWWAANRVSNLKTTGGSLVGDITGADPYIIGPRYPDINADVYRYIRIRMKSTADSSAEFFWGTQADPVHRGGREVAFTVIPDGQFREYVVDMSIHPEWKGLVNTLRLDPANGPAGRFEVDYIRIRPDTTPPTGSVVINSGADHTSSTSATLALSASDSATGLSQMRFSNDGAAWGAWKAYAGSSEWTIPSGDGVKTVYAQFRDRQYNISESCTDTIVLDTANPTGSISINEGAVYTSSRTVTLSLPASDAGSGVSDMRLTNHGYGWSAWEPYESTRPWTLPAGDGTRIVYAQFRDRVGRMSQVVSDSIVVDTTAPTAPGTPVDAGAYTGSTSVVFSWTASADARSGIEGYFCLIGTTPGGGDVFEGGVGAALSKTITGSPGQRYYCRVQARDNAGNLGAWSDPSDGISVVTDPGVSIAEAKALAGSESAGLSSKVVSAVFGDRFYIQEPSRSGGVMVVPADGLPSGLAAGKRVDVGGPVRTNAAHERWIDATVSVLD